MLRSLFVFVLAALGQSYPLYLQFEYVPGVEYDLSSNVSHSCSICLRYAPVHTFAASVQRRHALCKKSPTFGHTVKNSMRRFERFERFERFQRVGKWNHRVTCVGHRRTIVGF
jgi:hypothetical protein